MSARGKHGGPYFFHCPKCRAMSLGVKVIGVVREYMNRGSSRASLRRFAYVCECGHTGTSRHADIERRWAGGPP
jgi:hypothetical protein